MSEATENLFSMFLVPTGGKADPSLRPVPITGFGMTMLLLEDTRVFWRRRCCDHNCRNPETVREKIHYCRKNSVTRGLVKTPTDGPWSSYRWYMGLDGVKLEIDGVEF